MTIILMKTKQQKVDLITIQDIKGYTDTNFKLFNIYNDKYKKWNYNSD